MKTTPLLLTLLLCATVHAQETPPANDELGLPNPYELQPPNSDEFDRPLSRALAYDRRDLVESLLVEPTALGTHNVGKLASDLAIPRAHAARAITAAQAGVDVGSRTELLRHALPAEATAPTNARELHSMSESKLVEKVGLTQAQARDFVQYRQSVQRIALHATEVKIVREARVAGGRTMAETAHGMGQQGRGRVAAIANALGMVASPGAEARQGELRELRESRNTTVGRADALAEFRRADGTLDIKRMSAEEAIRGVGGVAHFGFALFLKELALVLHSGDARRLDQFVDGLLTTDFYINYGLFAAGARTADGIYGSYVRRLSQKRFMNQVLRSNLVLAAGLAVPMAVRGQFELDTYLVDVAALGLSVTLVKGALEGTRGVTKLIAPGRAFRLGRLASPTAWVFTAAETAVVLLIGDVLAEEFDEFMDKRKLRGLVRDSQDDLWNVVQSVKDGEDVSPEEIEAAVSAVENAYDRLREYHLDPLQGRLALFQAESEGVARQALRGEVHADAMEKALAANPALASVFEGRFGSVEDYLAHLRDDTTGQAEDALGEQSEQFGADWNSMIRDAYQGDASGPAPAEESRLGTYDTQSELLQDIYAELPADSTDARQAVADALARVRLGRTMDQSVYQSAQTEPEAPEGEGAAQVLRQATGNE